jgi:hypothetical protein
VERRRVQRQPADRERRQGRDPEASGRAQQVQQEDRGEGADRQLCQYRHHDERPVRMLGMDMGDVHRTRVRRQLAQRHARRRQTVIADRHTGRRGGRKRRDRGTPVRRLHDLDLDGALGAGVHAGRALSRRQPAVAHVALPDHAALRVVLRHAVGAVPGAVLAADARIRAVAHDAGHRVFRIGIDRAPGETGRLETVVAAHRQVGARRLREVPAFDLADAPPVDGGRVAVLLVARDHAALAADALPHVEVEAVLLARLERARRHPRHESVDADAVAARLRGAVPQQRQRHRVGARLRREIRNPRGVVLHAGQQR